MNENIQMWNSPWHALQHGLASGSGRDVAPVTVRVKTSCLLAFPAVPGSSWLARALAGSRPSK